MRTVHAELAPNALARRTRMAVNGSGIQQFPTDRIQQEVARRILSTNVVLDIGCGLRPQTYFKPKLHLCCEPHEEYVERLERWFGNESGVYVIKSTADQLLGRLRDKSVDSIFVIDVIEHLTQADGRELLRECERLARRQIVVFTPLGYMPQDYDDGEVDGWGLHGAKWQRHLSGWTPADFNVGWEFLVCQDFHATNGKGEKCRERHGAFWAIKTFDEPPMVTVVSRSLRPEKTTGADAVEAICLGYPTDRFQFLSTTTFDPYEQLRRQGLITSDLAYLPRPSKRTRLMSNNRLWSYARLMRCSNEIQRGVEASDSSLVVGVADAKTEFVSAAWAARRANRRFVACIPEHPPHESPIRGKCGSWLVEKALKRADFIWTPNKRLSKFYTARFPNAQVVSGSLPESPILLSLMK